MILDPGADVIAALAALGLIWLGYLIVRSVVRGARFVRGLRDIGPVLDEIGEPDLGTLTECTWCASLDDHGSVCTCTEPCAAIGWCQARIEAEIRAWLGGQQQL
jgi:hypothetical protein